MIHINYGNRDEEWYWRHDGYSDEWWLTFPTFDINYSMMILLRDDLMMILMTYDYNLRWWWLWRWCRYRYCLLMMMTTTAGYDDHWWWWWYLLLIPVIPYDDYGSDAFLPDHWPVMMMTWWLASWLLMTDSLTKYSHDCWYGVLMAPLRLWWPPKLLRGWWRTWLCVDTTVMTSDVKVTDIIDDDDDQRDDRVTRVWWWYSDIVDPRRWNYNPDPSYPYPDDDRRWSPVTKLLPFCWWWWWRGPDWPLCW